MSEFRTALVTGAASGIGKATAAVLATRGYFVIVCDKDPLGAEKVANTIRGSGGTATALPLDITDLRAAKRAVQELLRTHGTIDAVVANAGVSGRGQTFEAVDESAFDALFDVHVKAHFFLLQALVPAMKRRGRGAIVLVSSLFALIGSPNMPHYTAAKGALLALSKALAKELGPAGIRVNAVAPGLIRTPMTEESAMGYMEVFESRAKATPLGRLATAEDVADAIAYLLSSAASALTGQTLSPSGGEAFTD